MGRCRRENFGSFIKRGGALVGRNCTKNALPILSVNFLVLQGTKNFCSLNKLRNLLVPLSTGNIYKARPAGWLSW